MLNHSQDHEYLQSVPRPISTLAKHYPAAYVGYPHTHQRAQFLYASSGCMRVSFDEGYWMVPPRRAVWVPPQYPHQTGSIGPLEMRTLYIQPEICPANAPAVPCVLNVSQLLHELVMRAVELPLEYDEHGQDGRILATLLGEIDWRPVHAVSLPLVKDSRLQRIEHMLIANPKDRSTAEQWAIYLKLSPRSLSRGAIRYALLPLFRCSLPVHHLPKLQTPSATRRPGALRRCSNALPAKFPAGI
jgi:hypothetical protein